MKLRKKIHRDLLYFDGLYNNSKWIVCGLEIVVGCLDGYSIVGEGKDKEENGGRERKKLEKRRWGSGRSTGGVEGRWGGAVGFESGDIHVFFFEKSLKVGVGSKMRGCNEKLS